MAAFTSTFSITLSDVCELKIRQQADKQDIPENLLGSLFQLFCTTINAT
jgi:hypothetical protein